MVVSDSSSAAFAPIIINNNGTAVLTTKDDAHPPVSSSTSSTTSSNTTCRSTITTNSDAVAVNNQNNKKMNKSSSFRLVRYLSDLPHWQSYNDNQEHFIQQMPKIELHVHLDGSFDPDFLWQYMQDNPSSIVECLPCQAILPWETDDDGNNRTLPVRQLVQDCQSSKDYHKLCTCRRGRNRSLKQMLNCFAIFLPLVRRNLQLLEQLAFDFCQRQYQQNVVYTEVRYSPFLLAEGFVDNNDDNTDNDNQQQQQQQKDENDNVIDGAAVFKAITTGLRRGSHKFNITVNQILCAITWRPDWAQPTLDLVLEHWHDYPCATVGIDVAAGEEHFDAQNFPHLHKEHYKVFQNKALSKKYKDIPVTIHAGESPEESSVDNVRRAVEQYGASRIGHGYRIVNDVALMQQLRRDKIHLEVCPTSSDETGGWIYDAYPLNNGDDDNERSSKSKKKKQWSQHPIVEMLHAGLSFSFSSDDPAVFHTSLAWQYRVAMVKMGFTREQMLQCNLNAIDAAFCSPEEKEKLRRHVQHFAAFSGLDYVAATASSTANDTSSVADGESVTDKKNAASLQDKERQQHGGEKGTWRRMSSCGSSNTAASSSIHRAAHHTAADSSLLPSTTTTPSQWKRSMSANFVDRVYVYKPSGGTDNAKEYEYL